jgi:hypothetical protein
VAEGHRTGEGDMNCMMCFPKLNRYEELPWSYRQLMPPAARNLFVKRFLDFQKLLLRVIWGERFLFGTLG